MSVAKKQEIYEIKVDARESIRFPAKLREKFGIRNGTILSLHVDSEGRLILVNKNENELDKKTMDEKKKKFIAYAEELNIKSDNSMSIEEFLKNERRY